jgi:hypothetical protein
VATTGLQDFSKGGPEPMTLSEKQLCSVGRKWEYGFIRQKAKKLIPVNSGRCPVQTVSYAIATTD